MDLPLPHSCRAHSLLESQCGSQSSQLFSRRSSSFARALVPRSRDRTSLRILRYSTRRDAYSIRGSGGIGTNEIPFENYRRHLGLWVRPLRRKNFGIVHFEQRDRDCSDGSGTDLENGERPPFDLDLAVVLAGFAFEAYNTPAVRGILCSGSLLSV